MSKAIEGYMCAIDWDWELGEAMGGTKIYSSVEDLKECHKCWEECGIVKVKVSLVEITVPERRRSENET